MVRCRLTKSTFLILAGLAGIALNMPAVSLSKMALAGTTRAHQLSSMCLSFTSRQAQECSHSSGQGQEQASLLAQGLVKSLHASYLLIAYWFKQVKVSWSGRALQNYRAKDMEIGWSEELEPVPTISLLQSLQFSAYLEPDFTLH